MRLVGGAVLINQVIMGLREQPSIGMAALGAVLIYRKNKIQFHTGQSGEIYCCDSAGIKSQVRSSQVFSLFIRLQVHIDAL